MDDAKKIEILYDHYKDSFAVQSRYLQKRNTYTLLCLILLCALLFEISNKELFHSVIARYLDKNFGLPGRISGLRPERMSVRFLPSVLMALAEMSGAVL